MSDRVVSWVFYPAAMLVSTVYADLGPLGIRLSGIILSSAWFSLLLIWCFKQTGAITSAVRQFAGLVALSALGVVPYLFALSRPEQFMTLPILILCVTALCFKGEKSLTVQCAGAIFLSLVISCFFYVHPKSLFFLPFSLVALWLATETYHRAVRFALLAYAVLLFAQVLHESGAIAACTDAPVIQSVLAANTLLPGRLFSAPGEFIQAALSNIANFPDRLLSHLTFNAVFQSGWLPPIEGNTSFLFILNLGIRYSLYAFVAGSHLASLVLFLIQVTKRKLAAPTLLAALLASADILNALFFNIQNFYAGTQFVPISVILTALLMHSLPVQKLYGRMATGCYSAILMFSIFSMATLLSLVTPSVMENSSSQKASLPGQPLSIPVFDTQSHLQSITSLGASCGLSPATSENLVLDHMTYFAFLKQKKPIHVLYVSEFGYGGDLTNGRLLPFLKKLGSPGVIARCEWMPNEFREAEISNDMGYCCVNLN
ncbi:hypothetical protein FHT77_001348 [Rhizobium sp. BK181]|uniref:hypothetical protein n=1 Tax=Rhizobium sp. BK181 TaxID=2587072 RepID=UPI0017F6982D|nr:hypothetical protein [Rhizobium sp. BK181]MBB3315506.1 hypothetical protein [Rhizobium sp. BK181]